MEGVELARPDGHLLICGGSFGTVLVLFLELEQNWPLCKLENGCRFQAAQVKSLHAFFTTLLEKMTMFFIQHVGFFLKTHNLQSIVSSQGKRQKPTESFRGALFLSCKETSSCKIQLACPCSWPSSAHPTITTLLIHPRVSQCGFETIPCAQVFFRSTAGFVFFSLSPPPKKTHHSSDVSHPSLALIYYFKIKTRK